VGKCLRLGGRKLLQAACRRLGPHVFPEERGSRFHLQMCNHVEDCTV
jgi:hypothetical protein